MDPSAADLHARSLVIDGLDISVMNREHFHHMRQGGLTAVNATITVQHGFQETVELIRDFDRRLAENADLVRPVRSVADIDAAKRESRVGIIYGFQNATPIEGDLRLLGVFKALGVRIIQLTYMTANLLGDGCLEPRNGGLTLYGRAVIEEMNRLGLLIDLSHVGERTSLEAIESSAAPVAFTHACTRHLCASPRNKTDEAMAALAARGGVMGITSLASFVADDWREADLDRYLDHIDHAVAMMGIDHVALAMDFTEFQTVDVLEPVKWGGTQVPWGIKGLTEWPIPYARGIGDSTEYPNVTAGLLRRGYGEADVQKILGGNLRRLFEQVWAD